MPIGIYVQEFDYFEITQSVLTGDNGPQKILRAKGCVAKNENLVILFYTILEFSLGQRASFQFSEDR